MPGPEFGFTLPYVAWTVVFALLFAALYPLVERFMFGAPPSSLTRKAGIVLLTGGVFASIDMAKAWSASGAITPAMGLGAVAIAAAIVAGVLVIRAAAPKHDAGRT